ncbi:MAG: class I SAM-dependent methyltransferase [Burkholderiales bacterium]|nr:class I SAM-dependent methyltransferase [Burkholderiales bacterium]
MRTTGDSRIIPALGFERLTGAYDLAVALFTRERRFRDSLLDQAAIEAGHDVLDIGCGTGTFAVLMGSRSPAASIVGLDADAAVLAIATRKSRHAGTRLLLVRGNASRLPFARASFDRVVSSLLFHHLSAKAKRDAAAEILRVLRPGGELHLADWGRASSGLMRTLFLAVQMLDGFETTEENVTTGLVPILVEAGFADVCCIQALPTFLGTLELVRATRPGQGWHPATAAENSHGGRR